MPSINSSASSRAAAIIPPVTTITQSDLDRAYELGLDLGSFAATYWPSLNLSPSIGHVDYFRRQLAGAVALLSHPGLHEIFTTGFTQGFDDVAREAA